MSSGEFCLKKHAHRFFAMAVEPELKFQAPALAPAPDIRRFLVPAPVPTSKSFWLRLQNDLVQCKIENH